MYKGLKKLGKKIFIFGLAGGIMLTAGSCQKVEDSDISLLSEDSLTSYEVLYGEKADEVMESLSLSEEDLTEGRGRGMLDLNQQVNLEGKAFTQSLLFDDSTETLYGVLFSYFGSSTAEIAELSEQLLEDIKKEYGEPDTYPGLTNQLSAEGSLDAIRDASAGTWREEWKVGEKSTLTLSVNVIDGNTSSVILQYSLQMLPN